MQLSEIRKLILKKAAACKVLVGYVKATDSVTLAVSCDKPEILQEALKKEKDFTFNEATRFRSPSFTYQGITINVAGFQKVYEA